MQRRRNSISTKLQSSQELHRIHAQRELLKIKISILKTELQFQQKNADSLEKEINSCKDGLLKKSKLFILSVCFKFFTYVFFVYNCNCIKIALS